MAYCAGRSFLGTANSRPRLGPRGTRTGDVACLLYSGDVPFILRPTRLSYYNLVGEAYIHGIMQGQHSDKLSGTNMHDLVIS